MLSNARYRPWALVLLAFAACGKTPQGSADTTTTAASPRSSAAAVASAQSQAHARGSFAALPDRGELLAYPGHQVRHDGAYTWHRTGLSEAYALRAIADGHLRVTTPSGQLLDFKYDRHIEHPSGDWTWVGHLPGHEEQQSIITFGEHAAFGSIAQPGKSPLRLTVRDGISWLVETDGAKVAGIVNAATRPQRPDFVVPPSLHGPGATGAGPHLASAPATAAAGTASGSTVDVVMGYTQGFAADNGGNSGAVTRLNFLVDVANIAYRNSGISATARLVAAIPVTYTDTTSNQSTLEQLTGYDSTTNTKITPAAAFNALRAARDTYGADLVSLARSFRDPENAGCGIAWLIGGGQSGVSTSDSYFGYSVISDGTDAGTDGKTYFCLDETLAHEMGHNMGAAHDIETAKGDNGVLDADEYGAYSYSFGYKTTATAGNFYTIMAYGDTGQMIYRIFSDPRSTFCGGRTCGNATTADNARTLGQTIPIIASFRGTVVATGMLRNDFDGDGKSDVLWRNTFNGSNTIWPSANSSLRRLIDTVADRGWKIAGTGDFNGDGQADILWRHSASGGNVIWLSGNLATSQSVTAVTNLSWTVAGAGDFDGDGKSDILWRNTSTGANAIWKSGNSATAQAVATVGTAWKVAAVGDFDGDGMSDILWRNSATGADTIWRSANPTDVQAMATVAGSDWTIVGSADFNADGADDVLWRNRASGANAIWRSANAGASQAVTSVPSQAWRVAAVGDYNGDGKSDVLWRNQSSGADTIWLSANSATTQSMTAVSDLSWVIAP